MITENPSEFSGDAVVIRNRAHSRFVEVAAASQTPVPLRRFRSLKFLKSDFVKRPVLHVAAMTAEYLWE